MHLLLGLLLFLISALTWAVPEPLPPSRLPWLEDDLDPGSLDLTLERSLEHLRKLPVTTTTSLAGQTIPVKRLIDSLLAFQQLLRSRPSVDELNRRIQQEFILIQMHPPGPTSPRMLITGYYQPVFPGSLTPHPPFIHPLYHVPETLVLGEAGGKKKVLGRRDRGRIVPFWSRREIDHSGVLRGRELIWLKDPFDAFVLHIQGSGMISLPDGSVRGVRFAQNNGREYRSIGKYLVDTGRMALPEVSMDSIRRYLVAHPKERDQILQHNESYIFFQWGQPGLAIGNLGQPLTPGRSVAADQQWYPPGALAYLDSRRPLMEQGEVVGWQPLRRFVSVQDTGAALTGPGRMDVFWGGGDAAGQEAGQMKEDGQVYLLLLKEHASAP